MLNHMEHRKDIEGLPELLYLIGQASGEDPQPQLLAGVAGGTLT